MTELRCACIVSRCLVSHKETVNESHSFGFALDLHNISHAAMSILTTNKQKQHTVRKHPKRRQSFHLTSCMRKMKEQLTPMMTGNESLQCLTTIATTTSRKAKIRNGQGRAEVDLAGSWCYCKVSCRNTAKSLANAAATATAATTHN
eukprot:SAG11_NODE_1295_length_5275_cov_3.069165_3_plen_147_part_00